jgi:transposase
MRDSARLSVFSLSNLDHGIYRRVLPKKSFLLDALRLIDWKSFEEELQGYYSSSHEGQPEYPPVILLKMEFLRYYFGFSQSQCVERCRCDLLMKFFLQLPVAAEIVDQSTLTVFRQRLGPEGFAAVFHRLISQARGHGLIQDRLRLKDATHVVGDVAIPSALGLFAQLRDRMLRVVESIDASAAAAFRQDLETVRAEGGGQDDSVRLLHRVALVNDLLEWMRRVPEPPRTGKAAEDHPAAKKWTQLQSTITLAEKILRDAADPSIGDKVRSVVDPDVRRGKHGEFFDGYLLDVMMDADSELITSLDVLPANGDEAANAVALIEQEEQAHGNDIERLSIDGIGFNGEVLHRLEDPDTFAVDVYTPPKAFNSTEGFPASNFELSEDGERVRCPAGHLSGRGSQKKDKPNNTFFEFSRTVCWTCPLRPQCHPKMSKATMSGRRVTKNRYEQDYERARAKAQTEAYAAVRSRHPAIERKINEIVRHQGSRRAKYRGRPKVKTQQLLTAFVVNVKRMVKLLGQRVPEHPQVACSV